LTKIFEKKTTIESRTEVKLLALLKEYDMPSTINTRKLGILKEIKEMFFNNYKYDYQRPFSYAQSTETVNTDCSKYPSTVSEIFNPNKLIHQIYSDDSKLESFFHINEKYVSTLVDFNFITQNKFDKLIQNGNFVKFPLHEFDNNFIKKCANFLDNFLERNKVFPNNISQILKKLSLSQIQSLSSMLTYKKLDRNVFISEIITREYMDEISNADS